MIVFLLIYQSSHFPPPIGMRAKIVKLITTNRLAVTLLLLIITRSIYSWTSLSGGADEST
jgi:hypothetical protein